MQGRKPKEYCRIVRVSDAEFCSPSKIENSRVNWGSNIFLLLITYLVVGSRRAVTAYTEFADI